MKIYAKIREAVKKTGYCVAKRAFTLIELIISIVIIGIASMTLPLMISSANRLEERTLSQDIFFKSVTVMTDILSKSWDKVPENEINVSNGEDLKSGDANSSKIWYIKNVNRDQNLTKKEGSLYRIGSVTEYSDRHFYSSQDINDTNASDIVTTSEEITSNSNLTYINEYNGRFIKETSTDGANVDYNISVRYVGDSVSTDSTGKRQKATWTLGESGGTTTADESTNLKRIYIKASRNIGSDTMEVGFTYFSSNIGIPKVKLK